MPPGRRKGQAQLFGGMVACAAMVILARLNLDFLAGLCLGVALGLFFLGFRAFYRS